MSCSILFTMILPIYLSKTKTEIKLTIWHLLQWLAAALASPVLAFFCLKINENFCLLQNIPIGTFLIKKIIPPFLQEQKHCQLLNHLSSPITSFYYMVLISNLLVSFCSFCFFILFFNHSIFVLRVYQERFFFVKSCFAHNKMITRIQTLFS